MRKHLYQLAFVFALSATLAFAQTKPSGSGTDQSMTPQAGQSKAQAGDIDQSSKDQSKKAVVDQDTLVRQVKEQLATNPSFSGVNVEVSKDTVTLTGDVPTKDDRTQAKNLASAVPGVKHVRDHLKVNSSAANSVGAMKSTGDTSNQATTPSTAGSIAGNTEAQAGVASGSAVTGSASTESTTVGTASGSAIPHSDVAGSQTTVQASGQTGAQPATPAASSLPQSDVNASGSQSTQIQQIQTALQQQNIVNVQVVNNNNNVQLVGSVSAQADKDKAEQIAKQAAPGLTIQNNIQVSNSVSATGSVGSSSSVSSSSTPTTSPSPSTSTEPSVTTPPATSTSPATSATQPPMGEASSQAAAQSAQPPAAAAQSSTTTLPQSDVTASQSTTQSTTQSTVSPSTSTSAQSNNSSTGSVPQSDVTAGQSTSSTGAMGSTSSTGAMGSTQSATAGSSDLQGQIENAIKADTTLSSCTTNVNVTDTNIELTGTCPTGKERQSVRRVAQSFAGNRKVMDHIKVTGKGSNSGTENMGTGTSSPNMTSPSTGTNPPTSSGTTPPSSTYPKPPKF